MFCPKELAILVCGTPLSLSGIFLKLFPYLCQIFQPRSSHSWNVYSLNCATWVAGNIKRRSAYANVLTTILDLDRSSGRFFIICPVLRGYPSWNNTPHGRSAIYGGCASPSHFLHYAAASRRNLCISLIFLIGRFSFDNASLSIAAQISMRTSLNTLLTIACCIHFAYSAPAPKESGSSPKPYSPKKEHTGNPKILTVEQLQAQQPSNGLPSNSNVTLVYSTLGIGNQNYTCNGTAYVQTEPGDGAVAQLYDTTEFLRRNPSEINTLSQDCNFEDCKYPHLFSLLLGQHFFTADLVPTFDLFNADPPLLLSGVKDGDVPAPDSSDVDWLFLTQKDPSQGLSEVYRIDTFQGKPPSSCSGNGDLSVPYTAQYWFYR